jgi:hypothetical protein
MKVGLTRAGVLGGDGRHRHGAREELRSGKDRSSRSDGLRKRQETRSWAQHEEEVGKMVSAPLFEFPSESIEAPR